MAFVGKNYLKQKFTVVPPILKLEEYHASAQVLIVTTCTRIKKVMSERPQALIRLG